MYMHLEERKMMYMYLEERKMYMHLEERKIFIYRYTLVTSPALH